MPSTPAQDLISAASCYACLGMTQFEAMQLALWDSISQNIAPVGETFYILTELGDVLNAENSDRLETELAP